MTFIGYHFPALEPASLVTEPDSSTQSQPFGLKPCDVSPTVPLASSSSKILQGLSVEDFEQFLEDSEFADIVGTIHKSYRQRNSERRTKEKGFSSLPTPTTYAKGSTRCRPAGATRLEQSLRKFISKGDKLHPAVPGWMMGFPVGWVEEILMAGGQAISIQLPFTPECVTTHQSAESVTTSTLVQSVSSRERSLFIESSTSTVCCPSCGEALRNLADGCDVCGWVQSFNEDSTVSTHAENEQEIVLMVNSSTVSTELESSLDTETVLMVNLTVSTQTENEQEAVLTVNPSTVSTKRRSRGEGTGRIQWRTITKKNGKQYKQAWYDWQIHQGEKVISKTAYIPKRLIKTIQELEEAKVPIIEILKLLGKKPV